MFRWHQLWRPLGKQAGMRMSGMVSVRTGKMCKAASRVCEGTAAEGRAEKLQEPWWELECWRWGAEEIVRVRKEFEPQGNVSTKWKCHFNQSHQFGHWFKWGEFSSSSHVQLCGRAAQNAWISTFQDPGKIETKQLSAYYHPFCFHWCMLMLHLVWYQRIQTTKESSQTTALSQLLPSHFSCQLLT